MCALIVEVERPTLPSGGRGTDRDIAEFEGADPPDLALAPVEGSDSDLTLLCGGRGTYRPAGAGKERALLDCPSGARLGVGVAVRAGDVFCKALGLAELAGGVILLTVGREVTAPDGLAAV